MIDQAKMVGMKARSSNPKYISEALSYVLDNTDLNTCDECSVIEYSDDLNWFEYMSKKDQLFWEQHKSGDALCDDCWSY
tara:strand:+ start:17 stop:253 length:237 start_codon:yes stop_codon:yes gene_type:complete